MAAPKPADRKPARRRDRKSIPVGQADIKSTVNDTIISITDPSGAVVSWASGGDVGFKNLSFNFDSAAGIDYEVDVTKPDGEKVKILRMSNGEPFDEKKWYKVAVNSYRGNGDTGRIRT